MSDHEVISAGLVNGRIEIVRRYPSNRFYASNPPVPVPDRIVKEVYGVKPQDPCHPTRSDEIALLIEVPGQHIPAHEVPEQVRFPE